MNVLVNTFAVVAITFSKCMVLRVFRIVLAKRFRASFAVSEKRPAECADEREIPEREKRLEDRIAIVEHQFEEREVGHTSFEVVTAEFVQPVVRYRRVGEASGIRQESPKP